MSQERLRELIASSPLLTVCVSCSSCPSRLVRSRLIAMSNLRIGVPSKGRLSELAAELLKQAGLSFRRQERSLFARVGEMPIDVTFLRTDDIPVLCAEGAIDMGITGSDLVAESGADVLTRLALGVGRCRLALCVPDDSPITSPAQLAGKRVATSFPNVTRRYLQQHKADAHLVNLGGSVEIMIALGVADAIVDLVETGSTLAANRLRVLDETGPLRDGADPEQGPPRERAGRPRRPPAGRRRHRPQLVAAGIQRAPHEAGRSREDHARLQQPDGQRLEDPAWCAVRVMVSRGEVIEIMEQLEAIGAHAILETQINNCRLVAKCGVNSDLRIGYAYCIVPTPNDGLTSMPWECVNMPRKRASASRTFSSRMLSSSSTMNWSACWSRAASTFAALAATRSAATSFFRSSSAKRS